MKMLEQVQLSVCASQSLNQLSGEASSEENDFSPDTPSLLVEWFSSSLTIALQTFVHITGPLLERNWNIWVCFVLNYWRFCGLILQRVILLLCLDAKRRRLWIIGKKSRIIWVQLNLCLQHNLICFFLSLSLFSSHVHLHTFICLSKQSTEKLTLSYSRFTFLW